MKNLILLLLCCIAIQAKAQKFTEAKCGWIKDTTMFYAKDGRDMSATDTLMLTPWNKAWQLCCLNLGPTCNRTKLLDVGVYHEKYQNKFTVKGGFGAYFPNLNTIATLDYHHTLGTNTQAIGLNVLKQMPKVMVGRGRIEVYPLRVGFNAGVYKPRDVVATPYIEPKLGLVMPFGRGHIYASYRFISNSNETYLATSGWNFGSTTLFGL